MKKVTWITNDEFKILNENNFYFSSKVKEFLLQGKVSVLIMSEMWKSSLRLACTVMLKCLQLNQICIFRIQNQHFYWALNFWSPKVNLQLLHILPASCSLEPWPQRCRWCIIIMYMGNTFGLFHPDFIVNILQTVLHTFFKELARRIC